MAGAEASGSPTTGSLENAEGEVDEAGGDDLTVWRLGSVLIASALIADGDAAETPERELEVSGADVLVALARTGLSVQGEGHAALPAVVIHVDAAALPSGHGRCHVENGPA